MDIELSLRDLQLLHDPGLRFTDGVMSRVGDAPVGRMPDGIVRLADARARKRSRRILLSVVVVIGVAAAMPMLMLRDWSEQAEGQAAPQQVSVPPAVIPLVGTPLQAQPEPSGDASNPLDCLDMDVVRGLLLQGMTNPTFSTAFNPPPELADFKAPRQLTWVGSTDRTYAGSAVQTSLVYRTSLAPDAARSLGVQALTASGWQLHTDRRYETANNAFTAGGSRPIGDTYCRDGKPVSIAASALDGATYMILETTRSWDHAGNSNACERPPQPARAASMLDAFMPRLDTPPDPSTGWPVPMTGGGSGPGVDMRRRDSASFVIQDSVDNVAQHFARQLAAQGWSAEARWTGEGTAGSTWTRQEGDMALLGTLLISTFEEAHFTAVFQVGRTQ
jgi:hypothetical protein